MEATSAENLTAHGDGPSQVGELKSEVADAVTSLSENTVAGKSERIEEVAATEENEVAAEVVNVASELNIKGRDDAGDSADGKVSSKMKYKTLKESSPEKSHKMEDSQSQESDETPPPPPQSPTSVIDKTKDSRTELQNTAEEHSESGDSQEDFVKVDQTEIETDMAQKETEENVSETSGSTEDKVKEQTEQEKSGLVDILGNGSLTKKVLVEAPDDAKKPVQGDWVEVEYETYIAGQDKVLDSEAARKICVQDMDIVQGIDLTLMLMKSGEKAEIFVSSDKAYGATGRPAINVPPDTDLRFILTLKRICDIPEKDELIPIIEGKKERAKEKYMAKEYETAVFYYARCLRHLDFVDLEKSELALSITSNLAQVFINMQRYDLALQHAMTVVTQEPKNTKALLRLGKSYHNLGDLKRAELVLSKAADLEPSNKSILNELNTVKTKSKKSVQNQKKIYGKMFGLDKPEKTKKSNESEGNGQYYVAGAVVAAGLASLCYSLYKSLT